MSEKKDVVSATTPQGSKVSLSADLAAKLGWSTTSKAAPAKKAAAKKSTSSKSKK